MAQTPVPTASWQAGGNLSNFSGFPADTQIAVSEKSVVVTARAVIAFYDKAGAPAAAHRHAELLQQPESRGVVRHRFIL